MPKEIMRARFMEQAKGPVDEKLLDYILGNVNAIIYMTLDRFCFEAESSVEKVDAFLKNHGYENFNEFKIALRELQHQYYSSESTERLNKVSEIANLIMNHEIKNIGSFINNTDFGLIDRLSQDIISAPDLLVVGTRASTPLAMYATYIFNKIGIKTNRIDSLENNYDYLSNIDRSTLVVAFGFTRYPKITVVLLSILKKNGFKIVSITDYPNSPLATFSDYFITAKANSFDYTDSYTSAMMLINVLAVHIGMLSNEAVLQRLRQYDELAQNLEFYF